MNLNKTVLYSRRIRSAERRRERERERERVSVEVKAITHSFFPNKSSCQGGLGEVRACWSDFPKLSQKQPIQTAHIYQKAAARSDAITHTQARIRSSDTSSSSKLIQLALNFYFGRTSRHLHAICASLSRATKHLLVKCSDSVPHLSSFIFSSTCRGSVRLRQATPLRDTPECHGQKR